MERSQYQPLSIETGKESVSLEIESTMPTSTKQNDEEKSDLLTSTSFSAYRYQASSSIGASSLPPIVITIDDAMESIGYGPFQIRVMIAAGLCFAADAMQFLMLTFLSVVLQAEWGLTSGETAFLTSTVFCGALVGTLILGPLGDKLGRRPVFLLAAILICVFGFATAACNTLASICTTIFVVGFGVGGLTVPFDILAEVLPTSQRGANLLYIEYFWTAGTLLLPLFAYATIGSDNNDSNNPNGWRNFVLLCALPCLISTVLGFHLVPESPRWLVTVGQSERALCILRKAATSNGLNAKQLFPPGTVLQEEGEEVTATICDLFQPKWCELTIRLWTVWGGFAFLYYGTIISITLVFSNEAQHDDDGAAVDPSTSFSFDYQALIVSCSAEFFGTTFAILLIDRLGRVPLQALSFLLGGFSVMTMLLISKHDVDDSHRTLLIALAFIARWFMMSGTCTAWVGTAELLTTDIRTTGHAAANAVARLGGFFAPYVVQQGTSFTQIAMTIVVIAIIAFLAVSGLPETKGVALGDAVMANQSGQQHEHKESGEINGSAIRMVEVDV
jgi:MFS family permease